MVMMEEFRSPNGRSKRSSTCGCAVCASWKRWSCGEKDDLLKEQDELEKLLGSPAVSARLKRDLQTARNTAGHASARAAR